MPAGYEDVSSFTLAQLLLSDGAPSFWSIRTIESHLKIFPQKSVQHCTRHWLASGLAALGLPCLRACMDRTKAAVRSQSAWCAGQPQPMLAMQAVQVICMDKAENHTVTLCSTMPDGKTRHTLYEMWPARVHPPQCSQARCMSSVRERTAALAASIACTYSHTLCAPWSHTTAAVLASHQLPSLHVRPLACFPSLLLHQQANIAVLLPAHHLKV